MYENEAPKRQKKTSKLPLNFDDMTSQATAGQYNAAQKASKMAEI